MLHLVTGANGAGKTLNTLKWVRERQLKENRPVCYNGQFAAVEDGELKSWKKIDFKQWQDEADGTIIVVDECYKDLPVRPSGSKVPDYVSALAEHRRRGFDIYLICQHPRQLDSFVRSLIGPPGWHRHLKRVAGGSTLVSVIQWDAVNMGCERTGSGASGQVTMTPYPKEVYKWYTSTSLDTAKVRVPLKVWVLAACVVAIPVLGWLALSKLPGAVKGKTDAPAAKSGAVAVAGASGSAASPPAQRLTVDDWLDLRKARLKDFPHTAPAYDEVTKPVHAPYPAACVMMGKTCKCYTQQATLMQVSGDVCVQIVRQGFFVEWQQAQLAPAANPPPRPVPVSAPVPQQAAPVINVHMPPQAPPQPGAQWSEGLAARNAQARSIMGR